MVWPPCKQNIDLHKLSEPTLLANVNGKDLLDDPEQLNRLRIRSWMELLGFTKAKLRKRRQSVKVVALEKREIIKRVMSRIGN